MTIPKIDPAIYVNKWNPENESDKNLDKFLNTFNAWLSQYDEKVKPAIINMLEYFEYYTHASISKGLYALHDILEKEFNVKNENAIYTYIKSTNGKINSSIDYWIDYKRMHNIDKGYCKDDLSKFPKNEWKHVDNIVIVDDCCGTGNSLEKFLNNINKQFDGKTIYYIVICAMQQARDKLQYLAKKHKMRIILIPINEQNKAFDIGDISKEFGRDDFKKYSASLEIGSKYALGYNESESLMAFYNNTPNNTIGIFWLDTSKHTSIFTRQFAKPTIFQMQAKEKKRKEANYKAAKKEKEIG